MKIAKGWGWGRKVRAYCLRDDEFQLCKVKVWGIGELDGCRQHESGHYCWATLFKMAPRKFLGAIYNNNNNMT